MAFKIVYGAGETLNLGSEGKFGAGYGFLEMHRDERVKKFARDTLERRLMGNSYGFERGPEWEAHERIEISSFQRCGEWYVLSRLRPISESRGRAYFLAEFLLIDESEAKSLAAMRGEGSSRGVLPLDILMLEQEEIWFSGELWDRPGRWLEGSIDLSRFFAANVKDWTHFLAPPAFNHPECVWETDRSVGWKPEHVLHAMASTQQQFLRTFDDRLAVEGTIEGACFDLAWNSISLTNFYLDPKSGIDLLLDPKSGIDLLRGEKKGELPYTWTGVFRRIPMHDAMRQEGERSGIIVKTAHPDDQKEVGDEEEMISSGWIRPAPAPAAAAPSIPGRELKTGSGQLVEISLQKGSENPSLLKKWLPRIGIPTVLAVISFFAWSWNSNRIEVNKVYKELGDAQRDGNAAKVMRLIADKNIGTELKSEKFDRYVNFSKQFNMLQSYLQKAGETKPGELMTADFTTSAGTPKELVLLPPAMALWQFASDNDGLLKAEPSNRTKHLREIKDRFVAWQDEDARVELERAASLCGLQGVWEEYESVMPARNLLRLQTLVDEEGSGRVKSEGKDSDNDIEFRQRLREVISEAERREPKDSESRVILASLLSRATTLTSPPVVETPPVPLTEEPEKQAPKSKGIITMARFVPEETDKSGSYSFPKEGFTDVYLADPSILRGALKSAVWQGGTLRMPLPLVETTDGLGKILATSSKVSAPNAEIGIVDSAKDSLFKFLPLKEGEEPLLGFVAKNPSGEHECWIYLRGAVQEPIDLGTFLDAASIEGGGTVANLDSAEITVLASHAYLGDTIIHPGTHAAELADVKALGNLLLVRSARVKSEIAKCEELILFTEPANVFQKWFRGEATAPATPASTFLGGVSAWTEEKASVSVVPDEGTALKKFSEIQSWQAFFAGEANPDTSEQKKAGVMEVRLTSFLVKLCAAGMPKSDSANEPPALAYFLPSEDPLGILSQIPSGEWTIENLKSKLATALATYQPKVKPLPVPPAPPVDDKKAKDKEGKAEGAAIPEPPAEKQESPEEKLARLVDEARVKNGIAMKKNWENFIQDLVEMEKFVKWYDANFGTLPLSEVNVNGALGVIGKAKTDGDWLNALEVKLKGGDVSEVQFKLILQPKAK